MSPWQSFLVQLGQATHVTVVGPLHTKKINLETPTVFVDGGVLAREVSGRTDNPHISVGDGDSAGNVELDLQLPTTKDYSDLAFVLRHLPEQVRTLDLLGFLGGRRDHELINLGEAHQFLKRTSAGREVRFDRSIVGFSGGTVALRINGTFSVVVFEAAALSIVGDCEYQVDPPQEFRPVSSLGLSNRGFGTVRLVSALPVFVFAEAGFGE